MSRDIDRLARVVRIREAATRGIRVVPENADPAEFPPRPFACDYRPLLCHECNTECGHPLGRPRI